MGLVEGRSEVERVDCGRLPAVPVVAWWRPMARRPVADMNTFDPNANDAGRWATFVPSRRVKFRVHQRLGDATTCMSSIHTDGILYERGSDGRWHEITRRQRDKVPATCPNCGSTPQAPVSQWMPCISQRFAREPNGKLVKPPVILTMCEPCWDVR